MDLAGNMAETVEIYSAFFFFQSGFQCRPSASVTNMKKNLCWSLYTASLKSSSSFCRVWRIHRIAYYCCPGLANKSPARQPALKNDNNRLYLFGTFHTPNAAQSALTIALVSPQKTCKWLAGRLEIQGEINRTYSSVFIGKLHL